MHDVSAGDAALRPSRIRQRVPKSCMPCLRGKRSCNRVKPVCGRCARTQHECTYAEEPLPFPRKARSTPMDRKLSVDDKDEDDDDEDGGETSRVSSEEENASHEMTISSMDKKRKRGRPSDESSYVASFSRPRSVAVEPHADSDVHKAGQALVNLQANTPWSVASTHNAVSTPGSSRGNALLASKRTDASAVGLSDHTASPRSSVTGARETSRQRESDDAGSHVNVNGQPLWHGDTLVGTSVFNRVSSSEDVSPVNEDSREAAAGMPTTNIQHAFNGLLYPMTDSFPFETIWPSGANFKQEVLPLLPSPRQSKGVLDTFKRFVRTASPGLLDSSILAPAHDFLCLRAEETREMISLPWLASFLMIVAVGQESQRTCGPMLSDNEDDDDEKSTKSDASAEGITTQSRKIAPQDVRKHCDLLLSATYQSLRLCSFLGSPNLQTIYAQLLIGVYLLHTERASNAWPILGSITRQAQSIGLHVEPSNVRAQMEERDLRRKLWWTIVQQDVLLSSIFGRPLAVSRFTCRVTSPFSGQSLARIERPTTYQEALCEFSVLARKHLNEDQEQEWSETQLDKFQEELLTWYYGLPPTMVLDLDDRDTSSKQALRDQLSRRSAVMIQHSVDLCLQVQFALLSLYRNRLVSGQQKPDSPETSSNSVRAEQQRLNDRSLHECARCVQKITYALSMLIDLLGALQAGMLWVRVFYAFHAGVTAAYLALSRTTSPLGARAREDLASLSEVCKRLPDRFDGLKTVKATFDVLSKLVHAHSEQERRKVTSKIRSSKASKGRDDERDAYRSTFDASDVHASSSSTSSSLPFPRQIDDQKDLHTSTDFSPMQLNELLTTNNISVPAFNIARDTTFTGGVAPIFDSPYGESAARTSAIDQSGGYDATTLTSTVDGRDTLSAANGNTLYGGGAPMSTINGLEGFPAGSTLSTATALVQTPGSRPDRGFPEQPFGPMIAPPGPDASTSEIVSFWREFFALPFQTSDLG